MSTTAGVEPEAVDAYLDALRHGDRGRALALVRALRDRGTPPLAVMSEVVGVAQQRIGELWAVDQWSVAQEHAATAVSEAVLGVLGSESATPRSVDEAPVVVSCVEQEWHALPALLVAEHLRAAEVGVSYLGANASAEHLVRHVHETGPRAVALSGSLASSLPRVRRQIEAVRETGTPVVVGGAAFDADGRRASVLGANGYAQDGRAAVEVVRGLPTAVSPASPLVHEGADEAFIIHADREWMAERIREDLLTAFPPDGSDGDAPWRRALGDHLPHLVGAVAGALVTDDADVLADSLVWTDDVLRHRDAPEALPGRLRASLTASVRELPVAARLCNRLTPA